MTSTSASSPRVLIVEDEAITALDLSTELTGLGYEVCGIVDTAEAALSAATTERPAVVLMDIRLAHGDDGVETARLIGARHDTAIVFLTAHSDEATLARALAVSPFGYLIKPFRARDLKVAIDLARAKHTRDATALRSLHALATTDALTGLANRRQIDDVLRAEWIAAAEAGRPLAVIMADVDHFKEFNDASGHLAGDACLARVATILRTACAAPGVTLGRWGGEEFLAVVPGAHVEAAVQFAWRLVDDVRAAGLPHPAFQAGRVVTVSAGVAAVIPAADGSVDSLVSEADLGLYTAKRAGRSRAAAAP